MSSNPTLQPSDIIAALRSARDHLGAALVQSIDGDDEILVRHVKDAHAALTTAIDASTAPRCRSCRRDLDNECSDRCLDCACAVSGERHNFGRWPNLDRTCRECGALRKED